MSRGRLLFPFIAHLRPIDIRALAADPGLDPDFSEPALIDRDDDGLPDNGRRELPAIRVPCQVEPRTTTDELRMFAPETRRSCRWISSFTSPISSVSPMGSS